MGPSPWRAFVLRRPSRGELTRPNPRRMVGNTPKAPEGRHGGPTARINAHRGEFRRRRQRLPRIEQLQARARQLTSRRVEACRVPAVTCRRPSSRRVPHPRCRPPGPVRLLIAIGALAAAHLAARLPQSLHARRLCRLPHQGRGVRPAPLLRRAAGPDVRRPHLAARRHQRQRHAVHLHRGVHRRTRGAQPRQPEDLVRACTPCGASTRRGCRCSWSASARR